RSGAHRRRTRSCAARPQDQHSRHNWRGCADPAGHLPRQPGRARRDEADGAAAVPTDALVVPVVALATPATGSLTGRRTPGWAAAGGVVIVAGAAVRLALGSAAVGDRSATLLAAVLTLCAWLAARLLGGPRTAF